MFQQPPVPQQTQPQQPQQEMPTFKLILVGDGGTHFLPSSLQIVLRLLRYWKDHIRKETFNWRIREEICWYALISLGITNLN